MPLLTSPAIEETCCRYDVQVRLWHLTETEEELTSLLARQEASARPMRPPFLSDKRRKEWLAARILAHTMRGRQASIDYLPGGKPYLPSLPQLSISISHSGNYVCVAISDKNIGMDIEEYSPRALRLHSKFLSPQEHPLLTEPREKSAVLLWSAKEAAFKHTNTPRHDLRTDVRLSFPAERLSPPRLHAFLPNRPTPLTLFYQFLPDFVFTCAID